MSYILVVNQPNLGDAGEIHIHGLGTFKNGEHEISDAQAQQFRVANIRNTFEDRSEGEDGGSWPHVSGTELGPNLATAVESMYGVSIKSAPPATSKTGGE